MRRHDPAAEFEVWVSREKLDKVAAMRRLKMKIDYYVSNLSVLVWDKRPAEHIKNSKSVTVLYMDYLQSLMLEHADTLRKKTAYLSYLTKKYRQNLHVDEAADIYRRPLVDLYRNDNGWRKYVIKALESGLPVEEYDDDWALGRPVFADDVLQYTGVLEAVGADASEIFERYREYSATICYEYAEYLERVKKGAEAKKIRSECRKEFGEKTREEHDDYR